MLLTLIFSIRLVLSSTFNMDIAQALPMLFTSNKLYLLIYSMKRNISKHRSIPARGEGGWDPQAPSILRSATGTKVNDPTQEMEATQEVGVESSLFREQCKIYA